MFVNVLLNNSVSKLDKLFSYLVPKNMEQDICIGKRVVVPFGKSNKEEYGLIIEITDSIDFDIKKVKEIIRVEDKDIIISKFNIKLAKWISKRYVCNLSDSIRLMLPPGITRTNNSIYNEKKEKWIHINNKEKILLEYDNIKGLTHKRKEVLDLLLDLGQILQSDLYNYFNITSQFLKWFLEKEYIKIEENVVYRNPFKQYKIEKSSNLKLNDGQQKVYDKIVNKIDENKYFGMLLHGVTGSGKTEIYMQIIDYVIKQNKNAIVLVPEISLTPQIVNRFLSRFGDIVAVLHSKLSIGEKLDEYNKIKKGEVKIVIGARSAIFAPMKNIGIVIVDEEHDNSYKSDMTPKYDAKQVAKKICEYNKAVMLFASATPSINTYYFAQKGTYELLELKHRASSNSVLPEIQVIDLIHEPIQNNFSNITKKLYNEIAINLEKKEQTIIFINKRGYYSSIICKNCGYIYKCPNCDISLTYHNDKKRLICHYCGHTERPNNICPICGNSEFDKNSIGTQRIQAELENAFPNAKTIRMDFDTTNKKDGHLEIINKFKNDNIDILIGTQMIAKGHDFPNVTLVGVLNADMSLNTDDYRANELTYNLLTQVAGRAGRKDKPGRVLIQTYNPTNDIFELIRTNEYAKLYNNEIVYRKNLTYPPFCDILTITLSGTDEQNVINSSKQIFEDLKQNMIEFVNNKTMQIYSPIISALSKINNEYRYKILIKCIYNEKISVNLKEFLNSADKYKQIKFNLDINPNGSI